MMAAFAVVIAPNAWWLATSGFLPLHYVDARAKAATRWYHYIAFPLEWTANELFFLLPAIGLLLVLYWQPYLDGKVNFEDAIAHLISAA